MQKPWVSKQTGFTIVELLIVMVIIGILAAITVVAYNGVQDRARTAKMKSDVALLTKAAMAARIANGSTLINVTGSNATAGSCAGKPTGTDLAALPTSDSCWTSYASALSKISTLSGINVNNMVDPWGRPYLIDENEGEGSPTNCTKDTLAAFTQPFVSGWTPYSATPGNNVSVSGFTGCS